MLQTQQIMDLRTGCVLEPRDPERRSLIRDLAVAFASAGHTVHPETSAELIRDFADRVLGIMDG